MTKRGPTKGTKYTPRKQEQRGYFLPPGMGDLFKEFCTAGHGGASAGARGALVLFMALDDFPALRERAIRAADQYEPAAAVALIREKIVEIFGEELMRQYVESLPDAEKAQLLKEALGKLQKRK